MTDSGTGPFSFFTLKLARKDNSGNFTINSSIKILYDTIAQVNASYTGDYILPDYIQAGQYKITGVSIADKNGRTNEQELNYYIDVDINPPAITKYYAKPVEVKKTYGNGNSLNSYWTSDFTYYFDTYDTDIDYAIIKIKEKTDNSDWDSISPDTVTEIIQGTATKSFVITTAQRGKIYNVWAEIYDTHGNSTVLPSNKNYVTAPNMITTATLQYPVEGSKGARITWEKPEGNYNGVCIRGYLKGKFINTKNDYYFYDEQEVCTCITPEIDPAAGRSIEIFTLIKDDDGNQYTSVNSKTLYLKVPAIGTTITTTSISIRDINNEGSIYKFYTKTSKSAEYVYYGQSQSSPEAYHLTNLTPGTTYYIKVDELDAQSEELVVSVELSGTTKVDSPKNFNVVQQVDSDGKLMLHVTWDAAQGNFDGYKITVIPWNKTDNMFNGGSGKQFTVNVTDKTQTSYNIQRLSSGDIEHTIQAAYAYRIYMWTTNGNTASELTDELYMCTLPANTSISINNSKTSLDVSCKFPPADSPFANANNTKETWLYFADSEEALKASGNTNKLQLNPSLNSQSISTTTFSDFYDSDCYFAIKVILKFKYRTIETWSPVYVFHLDDVENVPIPPELLLYNGKLHDKYITTNSATLKWQTLQGNWDRVKIYLNDEYKISIENDGNEVKEYKFTSLNVNTEYILSAAVEYNGLESEKSSVTVKTDMVYSGRNYQESATTGSGTGQISVSFGPCQSQTNLPFSRVQMRYIKLDDDATQWCYLTNGQVSSSNGNTWTGGYEPDSSTKHNETLTGLESGKTYVIKIDMIKWDNGIKVAASRTLTATAK